MSAIHLRPPEPGARFILAAHGAEQLFFPFRKNRKKNRLFSTLPLCVDRVFEGARDTSAFCFDPTNTPYIFKYKLSNLRIRTNLPGAQTPEANNE